MSQVMLRARAIGLPLLAASAPRSRAPRPPPSVTAPYYELMAWRTQERRTYQVQLPEQVQPTVVVFLGDFAALGWSHLATCGRYYSGGWTTPEALSCVRESYDLESETFRVSYLAHEAQHFADNKAYPKLEQPELKRRGAATVTRLLE